MTYDSGLNISSAICHPWGEGGVVISATTTVNTLPPLWLAPGHVKHKSADEMSPVLNAFQEQAGISRAGMSNNNMNRNNTNYFSVRLSDEVSS